MADPSARRSRRCGARGARVASRSVPVGCPRARARPHARTRPPATPARRAGRSGPPGGPVPVPTPSVRSSHGPAAPPAVVPTGRHPVALAPVSPLPDRATAEAYVASVCFKHGPPRLIGTELEWLVRDGHDPPPPPHPPALAPPLPP